MNTARRTRLLRRLLVALIALACLGITGAYLGYRHWRAKPAALISAAGQAALSMQHVRHTATRDGRTEWVLEARQASLDSQSQILRLEAPRLEFFPRQGKPIHLEAEHGQLFTASNDIEVQDRVVLKNVHYRLDTQAMHYHHDRGQITIATPVEIRRGEDHIRADTMTVDLRERKAEMAGAVKGIFSGVKIW